VKSADRRSALAWSLAAGTLVGGLLLWVVVREIDLTETRRLLANAHAPDVTVGLVAVIAALAAKSARWVSILGSAGWLPQAPAFRAVAIGNAGNVLVSHLGEVARIIVAVRHSSLQPDTLAASIAVERVLDCVGILVFAVAAVSLSPQYGGATSTYVAGVLSAGALAGLIMSAVLLIYGGALERLLRAGTRAGALRVFLADRLTNVVSALQLFADARRVAVAVIWSVVLWGLVAVCILYCMRAVSSGATFFSAATVMAVHAVALILPAPPGRVGTIQASFAIGLAGSALSGSEAFAASIVYNVLMTIPVLCLGGAMWLSETVARRH
jgi:uncharacterized membrane protein YbhN (UPF0104 family)